MDEKLYDEFIKTISSDMVKDAMEAVHENDEKDEVIKRLKEIVNDKVEETVERDWEWTTEPDLKLIPESARSLTGEGEWFYDHIVPPDWELDDIEDLEEALKVAAKDDDLALFKYCETQYEDEYGFVSLNMLSPSILFCCAFYDSSKVHSHFIKHSSKEEMEKTIELLNRLLNEDRKHGMVSKSTVSTYLSELRLNVKTLL